MLTLNFKNASEIKDELKPNVNIVYFSDSDGFSLELREGTIDLRWVEYDNKGYHTGTETIYSGDLTDYAIGDRVDVDYETGYEILEWSVNGIYGKDIKHIMLADDFFNQFENHK